MILLNFPISEAYVQLRTCVCSKAPRYFTTKASDSILARIQFQHSGKRCHPKIHSILAKDGVDRIGFSLSQMLDDTQGGFSCPPAKLKDHRVELLFNQSILDLVRPSLG